MAPPHIKTLQELKGKRVGISDFNSIRHWAIQIQLKKAGLDLDRDIEWVRLGVNGRFHVDAIRSGKVECAPVSPWHAEDLKKEGCNALVSPADQYPDGELVELVPRWTAALMARSRISRVIGPLCTNDRRPAASITSVSGCPINPRESRMAPVESNTLG